DFAKPVKEIALPQDVLSTSDCRLIELKNQVQRLMEAHLAPTQPTQVNKVTTSCEICSGLHDTQYCMEDPEHTFVEYASSRTDEEGEGLVSNFMASQDARQSKFEADFKQHQSKMTNKIDTVLKAIIDRIAGALPSDMVITRVKKLEQTIKTMKAKRRAHVVISDDEQAEEEQGKNLMQELDLEALVPLHLATEGRFDDSQVSKPLEEQLDVFSVAKVLAESARKRRSAEVVQTYTRRRSRVSTSSVDVNTASRAVSIAGVSTADVQAKDKGKAIVEEPETPNKVKKRVQLDERQEVQTQATQEIDWSDPAVLRYHATQNRTFSKVEVRKNMIMYLKNQGGYKMNYFKGMTYEEIRPIFEKVWDQTQSFVPMDSEKEKESAKKAGGGRKKSLGRKRGRKTDDEKRAKKQKLDDDAEKAELKECLNIVEDEVEVIEPLSAKASITDWGIHSLGICSLYIADRADGSSKMYRFFSDMLKSFNMQDLEDMYKLVKETHKMKKPEAEVLVLWGDLKTIFEPDESDEIWKNQQDHTLIEWRLFDSYGVHSLVMGTIAIYMLVERQYPLTQEMLERMLNWRLQIDHECEMAYALIRFIKSQVQK
ncbi:hypothetical protein Tco_1415372, partial [Tanacetum coccineum]